MKTEYEKFLSKKVPGYKLHTNKIILKSRASWFTAQGLTSTEMEQEYRTYTLDLEGY